MSVDEYALLQQQLGAKLREVDGIWWRRVRPFFYRPLLSHESFEEEKLQRPCHWPGAFQYSTVREERANTTLNFLFFDQPQTYSIDALNRHRQKQIRKAAEEFQVRPIRDAAELKDQAYAVYLSFLQRTQYNYRQDRAEKDRFDRWTDTFREFPRAILLGAYGSAGLGAVSIAYWVNRTLIYASIFSETQTMKRNVASLLLHELRLLAASHPGITEILARPYQGGNTLDQFYLDRECTLVRKPARLVVNPVVATIFRVCSPAKYAQLIGRV